MDKRMNTHTIGVIYRRHFCISATMIKDSSVECCIPFFHSLVEAIQPKIRQFGGVLQRRKSLTSR